MALRHHLLIMFQYSATGRASGILGVLGGGGGMSGVSGSWGGRPEGSYRDGGGGVLEDRGSYREKSWGIIFGGSTRKSRNSFGAITLKKMFVEAFW